MNEQFQSDPMRRPFTPEHIGFKELILTSIIALVIVSSAIIRLAPVPEDLPWHEPIDFHKYLWMAQHPFTLKTAPFCYRLAVPTLVYCLPLDPFYGFLFVQALSIALLLVCVYVASRSFGLSKDASMIAFLSAAAFGPLLLGGASGAPSPDPTLWAVTGLALVLTIRQRPLALALVILAGTLAKESSLFLCALYYGLTARRVWDRNAILTSVKIGLPSVALLLTIRLLIHDMNNDPAYLAQFPETLTQVQKGVSTYSLPWLLEHIALPRLRSLATLKFWYDATITTFGPLLVFAAAGCLISKRTRSLVLRSIPFALACMLPLFLASAIGRMLIMAAPVAALVIACGADDLSSRYRIPIRVLLLAPLLQYLFILIIPPRYDDQVLSFRQSAVLFAAMIIIIPAATLVARMARRTEPPRRRMQI